MEICIDSEALRIFFFESETKLIRFDYELLEKNRDAFSYYDGVTWVINEGKTHNTPDRIRWR